MAEELSIEWAEEALSELSSQMDFIAEQSPQNANKVLQALLSTIDHLKSHPELFPLDPYKSDAVEKNIRCFSVQPLRVCYQALPNKIRILQLWHGSVDPKKFQ